VPRATYLLLLAVAAGPAWAQRPAAANPPAHVDPEALREGQAPARMASAEAIGHYLEARRLEREGEWRGAAAELDQAVIFDERSPDLRAALAEALALSGQLPRAEAEARRAVALSGGAGPVASRGHVLLAQLAAVARDPARSAEELRQAVRVEQDLAAAGVAPDPEPWRLLAQAELELGDEQAAQRALEELAALAPGDGAGWREAGRFLLERRQAGRAERYLRRAVEVSRRDLAAWRLLLRAHRALGRSPEVSEDLRAILVVEPEDPEALHGLGLVALEADDDAGARGWLDRYLRAVPGDAGAAGHVAWEWLAAGRAGEALASARRALAEHGASPRLRLVEGTALARLGRRAEAARALGAIGEDDAEWAAARVELGGVLARAGRQAEAARVLDGALGRRPADVRLLVARARAFEWAGRPGQGADLLERAARERGPDAAAPAAASTDDDAEELQAARGELLRRSGRAAEAVAALGPPAAARPRSASLRVALARALVDAGASGRAAAELRGLLVLQPDSAEGLALLARLDAGARRGEGEADPLPAAEELARRAVELRPGWPPALAALGAVRSARGDHAGAAAALGRAVRLSGGQAPYLEDLGDACRAAGRRADAVAAWRRALLSAADLPPAEAGRTRAALRRKLRAAGAAP
jgi:predicted Zn-dependent protease